MLWFLPCVKFIELIMEVPKGAWHFVFLIIRPRILRLATNDVQGFGRWLHSGRPHACGTKLLRSWVRIPLGAGLFHSLPCPLSSDTFIQVFHRGAALFSFKKISLTVQLEVGTSLLWTDCEKNVLGFLHTAIASMSQ